MKKLNNGITFKHNYTIDSIKGICILLVIISHYAWSSEESKKYFFPFWMDCAVPFFMIISGYVLSLSFQRHQIKNFKEAYSINILIRRVLRYTIPFSFAFVMEKLIFDVQSIRYNNIINIIYQFLNGGGRAGGYYFPLMIQCIFFFPVLYFIIKEYDLRGLIICIAINYIFELLKNAYFMDDRCYRL